MQSIYHLLKENNRMANVILHNWFALLYDTSDSVADAYLDPG